MDFTLTEEQVLLKDSARRYFSKAANSGSENAAHGQVWTDIAEMGWLSVMVPAEFAGFDGSIVDGCLVARELGRGHVVTPFAETAILGAKTFANDQEMLEQIAEGRIKLAYALQEDAAEPLRYQRNGNAYILRGFKTFVRSAHDTNIFIVKAFDETGTVPAIFRIHKESPALKFAPYATLDRMGAARLEFEPIEIGTDACLAIGADARKKIDELELAACLAYSAEAVGLMEFLVNATREYTETRKQFGQPIASFQVVRHKVVEMYAFSQLAESLVFQAADTFHRLGNNPETFQAVRAAFTFAGKQGRRVGKEAIQLHGAIGTMDELPVGHAFARLVAISQSCGGAAMHERRYAEELMAVGDTSQLWAL